MSMRYAALLRGVNVGKNKRVPMAEWKQLLEAQGFSDVTTLLNSGNAVFTYKGRKQPAALAEAIRAQLLEALQVEVPVVVKSADEVAAIMAALPWQKELQSGAADPSRVLVTFAQSAETLKGLSVVAQKAGPKDHWAVGERAAYLWCPEGILESPAGEALLGKAGRSVTTRNWATTLKIAHCMGLKG